MGGGDKGDYNLLARPEETWPTTYRRYWVAPAAILMACGTSLPYTASILIEPVRAACPAWPSSATTTAISLQVVFAAVASFTSGKVLRMIGPKAMGIVGTLISACGVVLAGFAVMWQSVLLFWLGLGVLAGFGNGFCYFVDLQHIVRWWPKNKGAAGSWLGFWLGVGSIGIMALERKLVALVGVVYCLFLTAATIVALMAVPILALRMPPPPAGPPGGGGRGGGDGGGGRPKPMSYAAMLRDPRLFLFWIAYSAVLMTGWGIVAAATPLFMNVGHVSEDSADTLAECMMIGYSISRLATGPLSDKIGRFSVYTTFLFAQAALCAAAVVFATQSFAIFYALIIVISLGYGGAKAIMAAIVFELFGPVDAPQAIGLIITAFGFAGLGGPTILTTTAAATASTGSGRYTIFFVAMAAYSFVGGLCVAALWRRTLQKRKEKAARKAGARTVSGHESDGSSRVNSRVSSRDGAASGSVRSLALSPQQASARASMLQPYASGTRRNISDDLEATGASPGQAGRDPRDRHPYRTA